MLHDIYMHRCTGVVGRQEVQDLGGGVGVTDCIECGGDGDWTKFYPDETLPPRSLPCVDCKGTGKRYIGFWPAPSNS
jgi:hypothetical protein